MTGDKQSILDCTGQSGQGRRLKRRAGSLAAASLASEALGLQHEIVELAEDFEAMMQVGFTHQEAGEIEDAAHAFQTASGLCRETPDPHKALAEMYLDAGRFDEAISECKAMLRIAPRHLMARDILSTAYFQKGEIGRALETAAEIIRTSPLDPLGYYRRGVLFQHRGDWRNALNAYTRAMEIALEDSPERREAEAAIDLLDQQQIRQILSLTADDRLFSLLLVRNPDEALKDRGYYLSAEGMAFVAQVVDDRLSRPDRYTSFPGVCATSTRMGLYN